MVSSKLLECGERLTKFLENNGYNRAGVDRTLFVKKSKEKIVIVQIYVDDIVFGVMSQEMVDLL